MNISMRTKVRTSTRMTLAALVSVMVIGSLTACGGSSETAMEQAIEQESGVDTDVSLDDESVTITDDSGNVVSAGGDVTLPDEFPTDIPLFTEGTLVEAGVFPDQSAFNAAWTMNNPDIAAAEPYLQEFLAAGFTEESFMDMGTQDGISTVNYLLTRGDLTVMMAVQVEDTGAGVEGMVIITGSTM